MSDCFSIPLSVLSNTPISNDPSPITLYRPQRPWRRRRPASCQRPLPYPKGKLTSLTRHISNVHISYVPFSIVCSLSRVSCDRCVGTCWIIFFPQKTKQTRGRLHLRWTSTKSIKFLVLVYRVIYCRMGWNLMQTWSLNRFAAGVTTGLDLYQGLHYLTKGFAIWGIKLIGVGKHGPNRHVPMCICRSNYVSKCEQID